MIRKISVNIAENKVENETKAEIMIIPQVGMIQHLQYASVVH